MTKLPKAHATKQEKLKGAAADMASATTEATAETALDNLPMLASAVGGAGLQGAAAILADGVVGAVAPGALGVVLNYRLKRMERNLISLVNELSSNLDTVNSRLDSLDSATRDKFTSGKYRDAFLDSVISENESEKVARSVNAFVNLMGEENISDSFALTLFDDLSRLNQLDIRVLRLHYFNPITNYKVGDDHYKLISEENIDDNQYRSIREKLCRLGLLGSKNEEKREKNLEAIQETLIELLKQMGKKSTKLPNPPKIHRISMSDSYSITSMGGKYLELIRPVSETERSAAEAFC